MHTSANYLLQQRVLATIPLNRLLARGCRSDLRCHTINKLRIVVLKPMYASERLRTVCVQGLHAQCGYSARL